MLQDCDKLAASQRDDGRDGAKSGAQNHRLEITGKEHRRKITG
jgi:hypothetical protein